MKWVDGVTPESYPSDRVARTDAKGIAMTFIIGIDPGLSGAIAILTPAGELEALHDLPIITDGKLKWVDAQGMTSFLIDSLRGRPAKAYIERVQAIPESGPLELLQLRRRVRLAPGAGAGSLPAH